jgi:fatty acid desaturase
MSTVLTAPPPTKSLSSPKFKQQLQQLRQIDNLTNWYYLLRTYALIAAIIGGVAWFYGYQAAAGISPWWNVPVVFSGILAIGALQHHLATLAHEAVHHILFKNKHLNYLASEWLCSLPIFSSTFHYGLHHLAHHQFVNDPVRDPDISQMETSGHRLSFPILRQEFLKVLVQQLWVPNLVRYSLARAEYDSLGTEKNPYVRSDWEPSKLPARITLGYMVSLAVVLAGLVWFGNGALLAVVPALMWISVLGTFSWLPERHYYQSRIQALFPMRTLAMMRATFVTLLFSGVAWGTFAGGLVVLAGFLLLWMLPLVTSFPLYMVLRQIVQHGNADRGWFTNSRVFHCNPLLNFAVFPLGQDYHLPHHMFATVPHYRLKELHEILLDYPEYCEQATVVEGYLLPRERPPTKPTVIDVLGPDHAPREFREVFIDNTVLEGQRVTARDKADIVRDGESEAARVRAEGVRGWGR